MTTDKPIFSGEYSRDMWAEINAIQYEEVKAALYTVCVRLQELEHRMRLAEGKPEGQK